MSGATPTETRGAPPRRRARPRRIVLAVILVACVFAGLLARPLIRRWTLQRAVLAADGPSDEDLSDLVAAVDRPADVLVRLWDTGKVAQRVFVADYLQQHAAGATDPRLWPAARPIVLDAVRCGDVDAAKAALDVLRNVGDAESEPAALRLLDDLDPELRRIAVRHLAESGGDKRLATTFAARLDDSDAGVRALSAAALRDLTGQDLGIRFDSTDEQVKSGAAAWRAYLSDHPQEYPPAPPTPPRLPPVTGRAADFTVTDLAGRPVRLSDYRGKVVLLNFWATWCSPCIAELPTLIDLARRRPDRFVILGVSADAAGDAHEDDHDENDHGPSDPASLVAKVVKEKGITYPVALDRTGAALAAYRGDGLPTSVLIDAQGNVRRRFVGARTVEVLERMIDEIDAAPPAAQ
jgi:thiol-disulfide isomerase/thioredoxin